MIFKFLLIIYVEPTILDLSDILNMSKEEMSLVVDSDNDGKLLLIAVFPK